MPIVFIEKYMNNAYIMIVKKVENFVSSLDFPFFVQLLFQNGRVYLSPMFTVYGG